MQQQQALTWNTSSNISSHVHIHSIVETGVAISTEGLPVNLLHTPGVWCVGIAVAAGTACLAAAFWQG
jgi:hypothetical protein